MMKKVSFNKIIAILIMALFIIFPINIKADAKYSITYNANGGKGKMSATTCVVNKDCTLRGKTFKRSGYTFVGWNTKKDGSGISYTNKQVVQNITSNKKITLYAIWRPIVYKIKFVSNGGTGSMNTIECTYGKNCKLPTNLFTKKGYKWNGWNTKSNGKGKNYKNNQTVKNLASTSKTITLYSKWSKIKYSIKYNLNGGKNNKKNPKSYYVTTGTINLKNPTRKGYVFVGWYTESNYTNKKTSIPKGSTVNVTLYARWAYNEHKIIFNANGGNGSMASITCKYNKDCTLPNNSFYRNDNSFNGWNTKKDGTGTKYTNKQVVKNITTGNNITLYAIWKPYIYEIKYDLDGGVNNSNNPSKFNSNDVTTLFEPTREGYTFAGWYTMGAKITEIPKGLTGNISVQAKWTKKSYNISYDLDGGKNNSNNKSSYSITDTVTFSNPTRNGYSFMGWYSDYDYKNKVTSIPQGSTGDKLIIAKWKANTFTVSFNSNGGTGNMNSITCTYDKDCIIPNNSFSKEKYTFVYWNTKPDEKGINYYEESNVRNIISSGNITLYAIWEQYIFNITYVLNGGVNNPNNPTKYNKNNEFYLLEPTREDGYYFGGWYIDSEFNDRIGDIREYGYNDKTVYAKWELIKYRIYYHLEIDANNPNPIEYTQLSEDIILNNAAMDNFIFDGWYSDNSFENAVTSIPQGSTGDKDIYAKWKGTISFDANGGTGSTPSVTCRLYDICSFPQNGFTRENYRFNGWNTKPDGTGDRYDANYGFQLIPSLAGKTLYAMWKSDLVYITYHLNGGVNNPDNPDTFNPRQSESLIFLDPEREDYYFAGWYSDSELTREIRGLAPGYSTDVSVYAAWRKHTYNVLFDVGDGTWNTTSIVCNSNEACQLPSSVPTKDGYTFYRWSTKKNSVNGNVYEAGSDVYNLIDLNGFKEEITLYAIWQSNTFTISFDANGGNGTMDSITCTLGEDCILPKSTFTYDTLVFVDGWLDSPNGTEKVYENQQNVKDIININTNNVTLYANWKFDFSTKIKRLKHYSYNGYNMYNKFYIEASCTYYGNNADNSNGNSCSSNKQIYYKLYRGETEDGDFVEVYDSKKNVFNDVLYDTVENGLDTIYYFKVKPYATLNDGRIFYGDYSEVEFLMSPVRSPKFTARLMNTPNENSNYAIINVKNTSNFIINVGGENRDQCSFYTADSWHDGYLVNAIDGDRYTFIELQPGEEKTIYYKFDSALLFENNSKFGFYVTYGDSYETYQFYQVVDYDGNIEKSW